MLTTQPIQYKPFVAIKIKIKRSEKKLKENGGISNPTYSNLFDLFPRRLQIFFCFAQLLLQRQLLALHFLKLEIKTKKSIILCSKILQIPDPAETSSQQSQFLVDPLTVWSQPPVLPLSVHKWLLRWRCEPQSSFSPPSKVRSLSLGPCKLFLLNINSQRNFSFTLRCF